MPTSATILVTPAAPPRPAVRKIALLELRDVLARGLDDFRAMPSHVIFLSLIYPVVGLLLCRLIFGYGVWQLLYPLLAGFALVGPFAAVGLYELSRRRERGLDTSWWHVFDVLKSPSLGAILALGVALMALFVAWLAAAHAIFALTFGEQATLSDSSVLAQILTTPAGWRLIVFGNAVGIVFAAVVLAISVVSFPLLLDRPVGAAVAVVTSVRAVLANPLPMLAWGMIVIAGVLIGSLPFLFGLAVVLPILGHATWHLYRRVVER